MAIFNSDGVKVTPLQAAKLLVAFSGTVAADYAYYAYEGDENILLPGFTERELGLITGHVQNQLVRVRRFLNIEKLW